MWVHADQIKALVESSWRYHIIGVLMALGVAFFALEQANRAQHSLASIRSQQAQIVGLLSDAGSAASALRQYRLADYGDLADEGAAITGLIKDLRNAKRNLSSASKALLDTRWLSTDERIDYQKWSNICVALLHYNDATAIGNIATPLTGESALPAAELPEGTFSFAKAIIDTPLEDLARLTFIASAKPVRLKALHEKAPGGPLSKETYAEMLAMLSAAAADATDGYAQEARRSASKLWVNWYRASEAVDSQHATLIRSASLRSLHDRLVELQKSALTAEEQMVGRNYFQLPVIGQNLSVVGAVWLLPFVAIAMYVLSSVSVWQAINDAARLRKDDKIGGITSPFLLAYTGPGKHVSLAAAVQITIVLLPFLISVAIGLLSPVVAAQEGWSALLWVTILASIVPAMLLFVLVRQLDRVIRAHVGQDTPTVRV